MMSPKMTVKVMVTDEHGDEIGMESFTFSFPASTHEGEFDLESAVNNISETQNLCGDIAKQAALSATWKAARTMVGRRPAEVPQFDEREVLEAGGALAGQEGDPPVQ